ncbi:hypothetical protein [Mesomycoplasma ovipneumoniae]|uniref:hypothetical protein n=1 Tax=Mesomycoplasma ovipneumoniae TaxID=29562 RepID=UPI0028A61F27|nr:hypothetical protein [Mesomycoplasma ovipneumoniae]MDW2924747.1 hypothetical protein [Mesomycoplasma ovipneumoniae]MDW2933633.1 hypothetical protein [Mesomycoplasma ovipneumoniae]WNM15973.1 hypothetical protein RNM12_00985 [Mesomycoplasma ovipneumoniae]
MKTTRYFSIDIKCASCKVVFEKLFANLEDFQWTANISAKVLKITADEDKYPDEFISEKLASVGYTSEKIDE